MKTILNRSKINARRFAAIIFAMTTLTGCGDNGEMVKGEDACIQKLVENGMSQESAKLACEQETQNAIHTQGTAYTPNTTLWYLIYRDSARPVVYSQSNAQEENLKMISPVRESGYYSVSRGVVSTETISVSTVEATAGHVTVGEFGGHGIGGVGE